MGRQPRIEQRRGHARRRWRRRLRHRRAQRSASAPSSIALVGGAIFGINPLTILGMLSGGGPAPQVQQQARRQAPPANDRDGAVRLHRAGRHRGRVEAAVRAGRRAPTASPSWCCSAAPCAPPAAPGQAAMGPFYCPADQKVYIDLSFYETLQEPPGRARRLRPGLRDRPRGRPPRAEPAGHHRARWSRCAAASARREYNAHERAAGTAGRLLRRRLGPPRAERRARSWSRATSRRR